MLPDALTAENLFGSLFDPDVWSDPYPLFKELRQYDPVALLDEHLWVVSSHSGVEANLRHPRCSSNERLAVTSDQSADSYLDVVSGFMVFMDPPDHTRLRRLVVRAFTPRRVRSIEPRAREIVSGLLDSAADRGRFDAVGDLGHPLAVQIICELLGVPFSDRHMFSKWGTALARLVDPGVLRTPEQGEIAERAAGEFSQYLDTLIEARREDSADDLLSELVAVEDEGDRLSRDELVGVCLLLLVAGYETTVNLLGNGVVALMNDRPQYELLVAGTGSAEPAVEELLRFDSPVQMTVRVALEDFELEGRAIASGDTLINFLGAANRDPAVFAEPDRLDVTRGHNPHLAFGGGIHHCLGAALARAEARAAFEGLISRFPSLELAEQPTRRSTFTLRGFEAVPVSISVP